PRVSFVPPVSAPSSAELSHSAVSVVPPSPPPPDRSSPPGPLSLRERGRRDDGRPSADRTSASRSSRVTSRLHGLRVPLPAPPRRTTTGGPEPMLRRPAGGRPFPLSRRA